MMHGIMNIIFLKSHLTLSCYLSLINTNDVIPTAFTAKCLCFSLLLCVLYSLLYAKYLHKLKISGYILNLKM